MKHLFIVLFCLFALTTAALAAGSPPTKGSPLAFYFIAHPLLPTEKHILRRQALRRMVIKQCNLTNDLADSFVGGSTEEDNQLVASLSEKEVMRKAYDVAINNGDYETAYRISTEWELLPHMITEADYNAYAKIYQKVAEVCGVEKLRQIRMSPVIRQYN